MSTESGMLLVRSPDVCGGRLRIAGTRMTVNHLVVWYKQGYTPEEIAEQYPHLTLAQVYARISVLPCESQRNRSGSGGGKDRGGST